MTPRAVAKDGIKFQSPVCEPLHLVTYRGIKTYWLFFCPLTGTIPSRWILHDVEEFSIADPFDKHSLSIGHWLALEEQ